MMTSLSHATSPAVVPATVSRPPLWAWPLAILLGFPIGGYAANIIVGKINSVGAALLGGLIAVSYPRRVVYSPNRKRRALVSASDFRATPGVFFPRRLLSSRSVFARFVSGRA
jgi:hypothetical protein